MSDNQGASDVLVEQQLKYCTGILTRLKRNSNAGPFLKPVDPVALGIPDYPERIKHPMDLSTIRHNLDSGAYGGPEDFHRDMKLMFDNCYTYNAAGTVVHEMGRDLQKVFDGYYGEIPTEVVKKARQGGSPRLAEKGKRPAARGSAEERMSGEDFSFCSETLAELEKAKHRKCTWPFSAPVSEKDAPGYFDVVKTPMDLGTIRKKLDAKSYGSSQEFASDLELIVENCYKFNAPGTEVHGCCEEFEKVVRGLLGRAKDPDTRINELRKKISQLTAELREVEKQKGQTRRVFSLSDRERIGQALIRMSRAQAERVAEIVQRHCAYEYIDNDEIELNMNTIPDEIVNEINEYISKASSNDEESAEDN